MAITHAAGTPRVLRGLEVGATGFDPESQPDDPKC